MGQTLFDKIWQKNAVRAETPEHPALLYVGLHLLHEITAPQAFAFLTSQGRTVRRADLTLAMIDHCAPTSKNLDGSFAFKDAATRTQIASMEDWCRRYQIPCFPLNHRFQGIVHAVAPELGLSQPGQVIVCGDSHTATHGAFGAIAFGIGSSEVAHVLASQCILQRKPKNLCVAVEGQLQPGVSAKDLALAIIAKLGASGGKGFAIEYQGSAIRQLSMEERLTLCNMTIEAGSRFGLIAPDAVTWEYLESRPYAPKSFDEWTRSLCSDSDAQWDRQIKIDAGQVKPMMTWGTNPAMSIAIGQTLPIAQSATEHAALSYMGWEGHLDPKGRKVDRVFIGSCTNGRISDLREAARLLRERKVAAHIQCLVVPASRSIKLAAEEEGLDAIFVQAGAIWGEPSCSLCNAMNGDIVEAGQLCVSTSNRNFEGRQGPGSRTILVSPSSAALIAIQGHL